MSRDVIIRTTYDVNVIDVLLDMYESKRYRNVSEMSFTKSISFYTELELTVLIRSIKLFN